MDYILEMRDITKRFPGILANDNVTLCVREGEIHAVSGENGAGKSTLMSILFGLYKPDSGKIFLKGNEVEIKNPNDANRYRIGMVHQHFKLVQDFTALENIVLGVEPVKKGFLQLNTVRGKLEELINKYNFNIDLDKKVRDMTVGMQQRVEILKMLYRDNDILIFDEPTAVLTPQEIDELIDIMKNLKNEGKTVIFISHKLWEVMKISDRCTVLWKGKSVGTVNIADTTKEKISEMMVGRSVQLVLEKNPQKLGETILEIKNLYVKDEISGKDVVKNVSLTVNRGEIVCIAGIDGNGQTDFSRAVTGMSAVSQGSIIFEGEDWTHKSIRYRNTHGMAHVPEDRHKHGLVLEYTIEENLILKSYFQPEYQKHGILKKKKIREHAGILIDKYDIRSGQGAITFCRSMSGGNQQKVILAREIDMQPDLLVAIQPTRGLDVGAVEYIHKYLLNLRDAGKAILLISLEMDEILNVSDRILVMFNGEIMCNLDAKDATPKELGLYMAGLKKEGNGEKE